MMKSYWLKQTVTICVGLCLLIPAHAETTLGGTYSSFKPHRGSGDLLGVELHILPSRKGYFVVFQSSEGEPDQPVLVPAIVNGTRLSFILPPGGSYTGKFTGEINSRYITGRFENGALSPDGASIWKIKGGASFWQRSTKARRH
jgi:hypothetical protein